MAHAHGFAPTPWPHTTHPISTYWGYIRALGRTSSTLRPPTIVVPAASKIGLDQSSRTRFPELLRIRWRATPDHVPAPDVRTSHLRKRVDQEDSFNIPTRNGHPLTAIHEHEIQELFHTHVAHAPRREATPNPAKERGIKISERSPQHHRQDRGCWTKGANQTNGSDHTSGRRWTAEMAPRGRPPHRGKCRRGITKTPTRFSP